MKNMNSDLQQIVDKSKEKIKVQDELRGFSFQQSEEKTPSDID
jgi:hypothetical protein